jgi:hypothetical protein
MTHNIMAFSIKTLSKLALGIAMKKQDTKNTLTISITVPDSECCYAECPVQ